MKRGSTGVLAIVELNIASPPTMQSRMNDEIPSFNQVFPLLAPANGNGLSSNEASSS
jgi:hypothetical protein